MVHYLWALGMGNQGGRLLEIHKRNAELLEQYRPGAWRADVLALLDKDAPEQERIEAARRLAKTHFSVGQVFHPERQSAVKEAFQAWRADRSLPLTWAQSWEQLTVPLLMRCANEATGPDPFQSLRGELRKAIEIELFGHTLDAGDVAAKLARTWPGPTTYEDALEMAEHRLDLMARLAKLGKEDASLLVRYETDDPRQLAQELGITETALRKRVERIRKKLKD